MAPDDDDALIARAVLGDETALDHLFRRYYATMNRFAQKICPDVSDAEDVAQEAFIKLMGSIDQFDRRSRFTSWLYRVVLNTAIDHRRKSQRRGRLAEDFRQLAPQVQETHQDVAVAARQVVEIILGFPERERDAALLVHGEGLTHKQAAEIIGCPTGTVGWLLGKAGDRLNGILKVEDHDGRHAEGGIREAGDEAPLAGC